jgi:hypothetical protein
LRGLPALAQERDPGQQRAGGEGGEDHDPEADDEQVGARHLCHRGVGRQPHVAEAQPHDRAPDDIDERDKCRHRAGDRADACHG